MLATEPDMESVKRHNAMIEKANARLEALWAAGVTAQGRLTAQGVDITIERPSAKKGYVTRSHEIIPY